MGVKGSSLKKRILWRIEAFFYWFFRKGLGLFPLSLVHSFGSLLGTIAYYLSKHYRHIVRKNLLLVSGKPMQVAALKALVKETFQRNGANLLSALCAESKSNQEIFSRVEFDGLETLEGLLTKNKGVVAVLGHMGNWEILARFKGLLESDRRLAMIYRPLSNRLVNEMMLAQRAQGGMEMFSYRKSGLSIIRLLKKGGIFSIMSDQRIGKAGEYADLLGRRVLCTKFPAVLHRQTGAPVVTVSMQSLEGARWKFVVREVPLGEEEDHHQEIMTALGEALLQSPTDVFWFQDRWKLVSPIFEDRPHQRPLQVLIEESDTQEAKTLKDRLSARYPHLEFTQCPGLVKPEEIHRWECEKGAAFDAAIGFSGSPHFTEMSRKAGIATVLGLGEARDNPGTWKGVNHNLNWSFEELLRSLGL